MREITMSALVISLQGNTLLPEEKEMLKDPLIGGVNLLAQNYTLNKDEAEKPLEAQIEIKKNRLKTLIIEAKAINPQLKFMIDREGGWVHRGFIGGFSAMPSQKVVGDLYRTSGREAALKYATALGEKVAHELKEYGIDIVLGPVVDLDLGNAIISGHDRAYSDDPFIVVALASAYREGLVKGGMPISLLTLKHYPSHANKEVGDTHTVGQNSAIDNRSWEALQEDLIPYKLLILQKSVGAIMPAHITYPCKDPANTAGTSKIWLQDILRKELHFDGVIISDCLSMKAAGEKSNAEKVRDTLEQADMAILCHLKPEEYLSLLKQLKDYTLRPESQARIKKWFSVVVPKVKEQEKVGKPITLLREAQKRKPFLMAEDTLTSESTQKRRLSI